MSKKIQSLKVAAVVICDDIRREINNKLTLVGVYSGVIFVPSLPIALNLAFWIQFEEGVSGEKPFGFRLMGPHGIEYFNVEGKMEIPDANLPASVPIGPGQLIVQIAGDLQVQLKRPDGEWETIKSIRVAVQPQQQQAG